MVPKMWVITGVESRAFFATRQALLALFTLALFAHATAHAQSYSIDWFTIDGGGSTSTGGVYTVSGTIGQPDAGGQVNGGNYSVTGGFWSLYAVQVPGAPLLRIRLVNSVTAAISWPSPSTGFLLQFNGNLNTTNWTNVVAAPTDDGTNKTLIVSPPTGNRFYRLFKP